jgi:hypothetical protein
MTLPRVGDSQLELLARARGAKRHVHSWPLLTAGPILDDRTTLGLCACGLSREEYEARQRKGRNNVKRGKQAEHDWAGRLNMRQTGGLNKEDDALNEVFVGQAKSMATARFPGWMSRELDTLRARWADRIPILGILESPGSARDHKPRRLIVMDEQDWIDLHVGDATEEVVGWIR